MSLIPFGFSLEQGILVDVSEAKKGRACKCICPSCKAPLLCRKGTINEWHFAHDPVFSDDKSYQDCEFSYEVSLRMMLRQLITEGDRIYLPEYHKYYAQVGKR